MSVVVLDTDVASAMIRRRVTSDPAKWTLVRRWGADRISTMRTFLDGLVVLPYDRQVAERWGEVQAFAQLRGRPRSVNDSWIAAACCLARELPLATFNLKDFAEHEGLVLHN